MNRTFALRAAAWAVLGGLTCLITAPGLSVTPTASADADHLQLAPVARAGFDAMAAPTGPVGPPDDSLGIGSRYLKRYDATRVGWDDVLESGRPLPTGGDGCADSWDNSGKDPALDWSWSSHWCLDGLPGRAYRPQGVAGSGTTMNYEIDGKPAVHRNLVLTSWYSRASEPGLFAPNGPGESVTRLVVMDLDRQRYNIVELVRPEGAGRFENLNSHGSGLAWAGQYLYSSSLSALWMYNADDLLEIDGHFVLPAVARWSVDGSGGLSSISLNRSESGENRLTGINYTRTGQTHIQSFGLDSDGLLTGSSASSNEDLVLTNRFGEEGRAVRSIASLALPGTNYQGVGGFPPYGFANSSALRTERGGRRVDALVVLEDGQVINQFQMPGGNVESIYIDYWRGTYVSVTEYGSQFLFVLPIWHLIEQADG